ncbi:MAG: hypothetical protein ABI612_24310, partial [Betaproteobacteria bacterium]
MLYIVSSRAVHSRRILCWFALAALIPCASAHDPSQWGGSFRSRDGGTTWMPIDAGLFIGGAVTIAVDPADPNHLFYATDTRLLQSRNGGRDWKPESSPEFRGPTLAIAFDSAGTRVLAATAGAILRSESGTGWAAVDLPAS